jgi:hypothetical protein
MIGGTASAVDCLRSMEHWMLFFPDSGQTTAGLRNIVTSGANRCQDLFFNFASRTKYSRPLRAKF